MKNILIINPWSGKIGPNTFLFGIVSGILTKGYQVSIIYPYPDEISNRFKKMGCNIFYLPTLKFKHENNFILKLFHRFYGELTLFFLLNKKIKLLNFNYCIINTEVLSWSLFGLRKNTPIYIIVHALSFNSNKKLSNYIFRLQQKRASKYLAVSNAVKDALQKIGINREILMVHNSVDLDQYKICDVKKDNAIMSLLSVVHPVPHKGAHYLINVLSLLKNMGLVFNCNVAGWYNASEDIEYVNSIKGKILNNGIVNYIHFLQPEIPMKLNYLNADILIHPSENESFGYALAEGMAMNLPVVAFNVGGIPEVVENNKTGFLIEPYDVEAMAKAVASLIRSKSLRSEFGNEGRLKVEKNFNAKINIEKILYEFDKNI